jgi:diguanylate cyclase (GGDEF)-like protein
MWERYSMAMDWAQVSLSLDTGTLFVIAICVTLVVGLLLLRAWAQERIPALGWWGAAYLIGAFSGAIWRFGDLTGSELPAGIANILLFVAVGMIWSAARLFQGRRVRWGLMFLGAAVWLVAWLFPAFAHSAASRILVSSLIVAGYTFLIAIELWRERRQLLIRRWPALFVPMLHGAIFLFPVAFATLSHDRNVFRSLAGGWVAAFVIEIVLYVVGAAFIVLILSKDRSVRFYKTAAATDPLTGVLNRRGFFQGAAIIMDRNRLSLTPVSVLAFDLDHFKSINDRWGHAVGDSVLQLFATVVRKTMRAGDIIGRVGGEEFVAILSSKPADAVTVAERVRAAFAAASAEVDGRPIAATISAGVASGSPLATVDALIAAADAALYRAKANGRDRVETGDVAVAAAPERLEEPAAGGRPAISVRSQRRVAH